MSWVAWARQKLKRTRGKFPNSYNAGYMRNKVPEFYFKQLAEQCAGGKKKYGAITNLDEMRGNLKTSCIPENMLKGNIPDYDAFLDQRRKLMASKIKSYFQTL